MSQGCPPYTIDSDLLPVGTLSESGQKGVVVVRELKLGEGIDWGERRKSKWISFLSERKREREKAGERRTGCQKCLILDRPSSQTKIWFTAKSLRYDDKTAPRPPTLSLSLSLSLSLPGNGSATTERSSFIHPVVPGMLQCV